MNKTNLKPHRGFISRRLYRVIVTWLDRKGYMTTIGKTKRVHNYFVYVNGEIDGHGKKTRMAAMRQVFRIFLKVLETGKYNIKK